MSLNRVFVAATSVTTAADWNGVQAAWDAYSPTATNFTVGNGSLTGRSLRLGKTILPRINYAAGTTSSYTASNMTISLPYAAHATGEQTLGIKFVTNGGVFYAGVMTIAAGASVGVLMAPAAPTQSNLSFLNTSGLTPGTLGNVVIDEGTYEAA